MNNTLTIAWRETQSYFSTPTAYVVGAMFLILTGIFFVFDVTTPFPEASVRGFISWASFFVVFLSPLLTMRLLAEEQKMGTLELLLTSPVRDWEVVAGKYIASLLTMVVTIALTGYYVFLLYAFGDPDSGPVLSAYLGLFLFSAAALAIGLMASSLSSNQIVAAVIGMSVLLTLSFINRVADIVSGTAA
ncbi:MAG: ABC transporter permease, partial [Chloroflexi bacterium]|nr:ABC transporter permease [Chloroflexota bacterium]